MVPECIKQSLHVADMYISPIDVGSLDIQGLHTRLNQIEAAKRPLTGWLREQRRNRTHGIRCDKSLLELAESAEVNLASAIGSIHAEFGKRRAARIENESQQPHDVIAVSQRLAGEVERLQRALDARDDNSFYVAFYEAARVILAENTVSRISERARHTLRTERLRK